jgi:hypothetical protein
MSKLVSGGQRLHQLRAARWSFIALREAAVLDFWRLAAAGKTFLHNKKTWVDNRSRQWKAADLQRPPFK